MSILRRHFYFVHSRNCTRQQDPPSIPFFLTPPFTPFFQLNLVLFKRRKQAFCLLGRHFVFCAFFPSLVQVRPWTLETALPLMWFFYKGWRRKPGQHISFISCWFFLVILPLKTLRLDAVGTQVIWLPVLLPCPLDLPSPRRLLNRLVFPPPLPQHRKSFFNTQTYASLFLGAVHVANPSPKVPYPSEMSHWESAPARPFSHTTLFDDCSLSTHTLPPPRQCAHGRLEPLSHHVMRFFQALRCCPPLRNFGSRPISSFAKCILFRQMPYAPFSSPNVDGSFAGRYPPAYFSDDILCSAYIPFAQDNLVFLY